jgi:hypothetical protein
MKGKPDLRGFTQMPAPAKPLDDFLREGAADQAIQGAGPLQVPSSSGAVVPVDEHKPEPQLQKLFRFRWDTVHALRLGAAEESNVQGRRVTETEIVESLIRKRFKLPKL